MIVVSVFVILCVIDLYLSYTILKKVDKYETALREIAKADTDMNKLVCIAIKALKE